MDKLARVALKEEIASVVINDKGGLPLDGVPLSDGRTLVLRRKNGKLYRIELVAAARRKRGR